MNTLDIVYQDLLGYILGNGVEKKDRTGTGTLSLFGYQIRHDMREGFPLLTTKKMAWKQIVTELLWFINGRTDLKCLLDNDCHIWVGDAFRNYCNQIPEYSKQFTMCKEEFINKIKTDDEFAKKWGELGPIYGKQWRNWRGQDGMIGEKDENGTRIITWNQIDQIANLISELKTNPDSRRLMVNAWNVGELDQMTLPPCHYGFQVYTRELNTQERMSLYYNSSYTKDIFPTDDYGWNSLFDDYNIPTRAISLMFNMRSVDTGLGLPFNLASYGLLLEILGKMVNMVPDELIGNLGDVHIYLNQVEGIKEQLEREPFELPKLDIKLHFQNDKPFNPEHWLVEDFQLVGYQSHPAIKLPLSN